MHQAIRGDWLRVYLMWACASSFEAVILLLRFAVAHDDPYIMERVLRDPHFAATEWRLFSIARTLCYRGHVQCLRALLDAHGADCMWVRPPPGKPHVLALLDEDILDRDAAIQEIRHMWHYFCNTDRPTIVSQCVHAAELASDKLDLLEMLGRDYGATFPRYMMLDALTRGDAPWVDRVERYLADRDNTSNPDIEFQRALYGGDVGLSRRFGVGRLPLHPTDFSVNTNVLWALNPLMITEEFGFPGNRICGVQCVYALQSVPLRPALRLPKIRPFLEALDIPPGTLSDQDVRDITETVTEPELADVVKYLIARAGPVDH